MIGLILAIALFTGVLIAWILLRESKFVKNRVLEVAQRELDKIISDIHDTFNDIENLKFYTNGHPIYWTPISKQEFEYQFINGCVLKNLGGFPVGYHYSLKIDKDENTVYFVPGQRDFIFSRLSHSE